MKLKDQVKEVLDRHIDNYWHNMSESTKEAIAEEIADLFGEDEKSYSIFGPEADRQIKEDLDNLTIRKQ